MSIRSSLRNLTEAIILQSVEDLWDEGHKSECLTFFEREGFDICAGIAGIESSDRLRLIDMIRSATGISIETKGHLEHSSGGR
jgi:hypothetical protein